MSTLPISRFVVERYRGLQGLEVANPSRFSLLVGANNTGKTSVLEAIAIYARSTDAWHWVRVVEARGPSQDRREVMESLRWAFPAHQGQEPGRVVLVSDGAHAIRRVEASMRELEAIATQENLPPQEGRPVIDRTELGLALDVRASGQSATLFGDRLEDVDVGSFEFWEGRGWGRPRVDRRHDLPVAYVAPGSHRDPRALVRGVSVVIDAGMRPLLVDAARRFDNSITDVIVSDPSGDLSRVRVQHQKLGVVPVVAFGDGMRRALAIAAGILAARGGVLLVDEIETAMHVSVLADVFPWLLRLAADHDVQVFATTHSLEALDALLDDESADEIASYHLRRSEGRVVAKRYSAEDLRFLRHERALDIR